MGKLAFQKSRKSCLVMRAVRISMCAMGRCVCPSFYNQEVLIQIGLMGQVQAFFADIEYLILGAVNGG